MKCNPDTVEELVDKMMEKISPDEIIAISVAVAKANPLLIPVLYAIIEEAKKRIKP